MSSRSDWAVSLETPAVARFLHVIRLTTAGAAAEAGLNAEEVDDVKIAVDELCSIMIEAAGASEQLSLRFVASDGALMVEAASMASAELEVDELAQAILDATLDTLEMGQQAPGSSFRLTKIRSDS